MSERVTYDTVEVGDNLPSIERTPSQENFNRFAVAGLDFNPVHTDPDWIKATKDVSEKFFTSIWDIEENVAHGLLTMSWMSSLVTDWVLEDGGFMTCIDASLARPVTSGTTVTVTGEVTEKHPTGDPRAAYHQYSDAPPSVDERSGDNFVTVEISAENQAGNPVGKAEAIVRLPESRDE